METSNTRVLVTGATVGKFAIKELLADHPNVRVRACFHSKQLELAHERLEWIKVEYDNMENLKQAMKGVNKVLLITAGGPKQIEYNKNIIKAIVEEHKESNQVDRIVKIGSLDKRNVGKVIQVEKWCAQIEEMIEETKIPHVFLRPSWFNQNYTEYFFAPMITKSPHTVMLPIGEAKAGWIDCQDIASVAVKGLLQPATCPEGEVPMIGKAFALTGPALIGKTEMLAAMNKYAGGKIKFKNIPAFMSIIFAMMAGFPYKDARAMTELLTKLRDNHLTDVTNDVEQILKRKPITFEQFVENNKEFFMEIAKGK